MICPIPTGGQVFWRGLLDHQNPQKLVTGRGNPHQGSLAVPSHRVVVLFASPEVFNDQLPHNQLQV